MPRKISPVNINLREFHEPLIVGRGIKTLPPCERECRPTIAEEVEVMFAGLYANSRASYSGIDVQYVSMDEDLTQRLSDQSLHDALNSGESPEEGIFATRAELGKMSRIDATDPHVLTDSSRRAQGYDQTP